MVGAALQLVAFLFFAYMSAYFSSVTDGFTSFGPWMMMRWMMGYPQNSRYGVGVIWLILAVVVVGLGTYGAITMNSSNLARVRMGSTLVLIASIISFPTMWGFLIGSLLMFVGSLLGLTWVPPHSQTS